MGNYMILNFGLLIKYLFSMYYGVALQCCFESDKVIVFSKEIFLSKISFHVRNKVIFRKENRIGLSMEEYDECLFCS